MTKFQIHSIEWLVENIERESVGTADPAVQTAVDAFLSYLTKLGGADGKPNLWKYRNHLYLNKTKAGRSRLLLHRFLELFEPAIKALCDKDASLADQLDFINIRFPLRQYFLEKPVRDVKGLNPNADESKADPRDSFFSLGKKFLDIARDIDEEIDRSHSDVGNLHASADSMRVVGVILQSISLLSQKTTSSTLDSHKRSRVTSGRNRKRICRICYRAAAENALHCRAHKHIPEKTSQAEHKKLSRAEGKPNIERWVQFGSSRNLRGLPLEVSVMKRFESDDLEDFLRRTLQGDWREMREIWLEQVLPTYFPEVSQRLSAETIKSKSWMSFLNLMWRDLDNVDETDISPESVLQILRRAQEWYVFENRLAVATPVGLSGDGASKSEQIRRLYLEDPGLSMTEIARKLGCSKPLVSRTLKQLRK